MPVLKQEVVGAHIRRLRLANSMSLRALASRTNFSPSFISQLENGLVSPSVNSMQKIAEALGVSLGDFFAAAGECVAGIVVRPSARLVLSSSWSRAVVESLGPRDGARTLEPILISLEVGGQTGKRPYPRPVEEFALVLDGRVRLTLGMRDHDLEPGDAITIRPRELRLWRNSGESTARILVVSTRSEPAVVSARHGVATPE